MSIIFSQTGHSTHKIDKSAFGPERNLQEYIHSNPEAIPLYDIQTDKRLFVVAREFPTGSESIDALAVDRDGDIYIVETKLYANPDKRRVIAQVLDYGASLWKEFSEVEAFLSMLDRRVRSKWNMDFRDKTKDFFGLNDDETDEMVKAIGQNLKDGNLKFVVVMDTVSQRLKDLITYVNLKSSFNVYGVELEYYKHEDFEIVIPKLFGAEIKAEGRVADKAAKTMEILKDGEWHTAPELRQKLGTTSISSVLYSLQEKGLVEMERNAQGNRVRMAKKQA